MSTEGIIRFELVDSYGEPHQYSLTLHPGGEGSLIAMQLAAMVSEPIIGLLTGLLSGSGSVSLKGLLDADLGAMLEALDASSIGPSVAKALASPEAQRMIRSDFVRYIARDGKQLSNATNFDQAFQGNYLELFKLSWEVAKRNRFLPLDAISKKGSKPAN